jgi:hypothetical protein
VHLHVLVTDGVFLREGPEQALVFHEGAAPSREEIAAVAARVEQRMTRWLRRRGLVDERSNEAHEPSPLEACISAASTSRTCWPARAADVVGSSPTSTTHP